MSGIKHDNEPARDDAADKRHDQRVAEEFEGLDNDLVNVGKFTDPSAEGDAAKPADEAETPASGQQGHVEAGMRS